VPQRGSTGQAVDSEGISVFVEQLEAAEGLHGLGCDAGQDCANPRFGLSSRLRGGLSLLLRGAQPLHS
jgi:hypothetical protein